MKKNRLVLTIECGNLCALRDFVQCKGVITNYSSCNICSSKRDDRYINTQCIRESIICNSCNSVRKI